MKLSPTLLDKALSEKANDIKATFLTEWTPKQFKIMEGAICSHFRKLGEIVTDSGHGSLQSLYSYVAISNYLGLAYTSSSSYAGYWICNVSAINDKYPGYHYTGFALASDNKAYAILWDKDENEIVIPL